MRYSLIIDNIVSSSRSLHCLLLQKQHNHISADEEEASISFFSAMEEIYGLPLTAPEYSDKALMSPENLIFAADYPTFLAFRDRNPALLGSDHFLPAVAVAEAAEPPSISPEIHDDDADASSLIKAKIASHPHYPRLLQAYIDCQKVICFSQRFCCFLLCFSILIVYCTVLC